MVDGEVPSRPWCPPLPFKALIQPFLLSGLFEESRLAWKKFPFIIFTHIVIKAAQGFELLFCGSDILNMWFLPHEPIQLPQLHLSHLHSS